ncbi:MAG: hypothetical protein H2212_12845 [Ruminococcus sp.]|nr:hypothetical protein [Ruminococcus sp.]
MRDYVVRREKQHEKWGKPRRAERKSQGIFPIFAGGACAACKPLTSHT